MEGDVVADRYRVVGRLGAGGMGVIYQAEHVETGRRVALKLIHADVHYDSNAALWTERFRREARAAAAVETPHAVQVLDAGKDERTGRNYIAMELLRGEDLSVVLKRVHALPVGVALAIVGQACRGLAAAHAVGVLHRDLKPSNLFLVTDDSGRITVKLVDFGIAKITKDEKLTTITRTGQLVGTPLYLSPEQARGVPRLDPAADVFSMGVVLYKTLCGTTPHALDVGLLDFVIRICSEPAPSLRGRAPWVPAPVAAVVHRALCLDPDDRYPDAAALLAAIESLQPDLTLRTNDLVAVSSSSTKASGPPPATPFVIANTPEPAAPVARRQSRTTFIILAGTAAALAVIFAAALGLLLLRSLHP